MSFSSPILLRSRADSWSQLSSLRSLGASPCREGPRYPSWWVADLSLIRRIEHSNTQTQQTLVMVDLSPSSRTAAYRDASNAMHELGNYSVSVDYRVRILLMASVDHTDFLPPTGKCDCAFSVMGDSICPRLPADVCHCPIRIWSI